MSARRQISFFESGPPSLDPVFSGIERRDLGRGAWVDHLPHWVRGSLPLFEELRRSVRWERYPMRMYDRVVDQPRLSARLERGDWSRWPLVAEMADALGARYGEEFRSCWLNLYRDGADSVAWHGDRHGREQDTALVADVSLGSARRFLLRLKGGGRRSLRFELGGGDLLVMGGTCQRTFEHSVPKAAHAEARISITFRPWEAD